MLAQLKNNPSKKVGGFILSWNLSYLDFNVDIEGEKIASLEVSLVDFCSNLRFFQHIYSYMPLYAF